MRSARDSNASPTPPPVEWPTDWTAPPRIRRTWVGVITSLLVGVPAAFLLWRAVTRSETDALVMAGILAGLALLGLGVAARTGPRGAPELVNAVALSRAETPPVDSWVHLVRDRGAGAPLIAGILLMGAAFTGGCVVALLELFVSASDRPVWPVIGSIVGVIAGIALLLVGAALWIGRARNASFGRRPAGFALGKSGISLFAPGSEGFVPWTAITDVRAERWESSRGGATRWIVLTIDDGSGPRTAPISAEAAVVHPWALWAMIVLPVRDPAWRAQLGTGQAQTELVGWSDGALAAAPDPGW